MWGGGGGGGRRGKKTYVDEGVVGKGGAESLLSAGVKHPENGYPEERLAILPPPKKKGVITILKGRGVEPKPFNFGRNRRKRTSLSPREASRPLSSKTEKEKGMLWGKRKERSTKWQKPYTSRSAVKRNPSR